MEAIVAAAMVTIGVEGTAEEEATEEAIMVLVLGAVMAAIMVLVLGAVMAASMVEGR